MKPRVAFSACSGCMAASDTLDEQLSRVGTYTRPRRFARVDRHSIKHGGDADVLPVPRVLQQWLDATARQRLQPASGPQFDFSDPAGAPALVPADSVAWMVFKNPLTLFIGGVAAVLLELAEPRVRDGVWQNSSFRTDPMTRLQRTGLAAMVTVYGARAKAEAMIENVTRMHARVSGITSEGEAYRADDPKLLDWVQATASFGFLEAYSAYALGLDADEFDAAYADMADASRLYGASGAPLSRAGTDAMFCAMRDRLVPSPIIFEFLDIMSKVPALPAAARPLQAMLVRAAVDILPRWARDLLGLGERGLRGWERPLVRGLGRAADRVLLPSSPAVQSCLRLGLTADYLYRRS